MTRTAFMSQVAAGVLALGCLLTPSAASAQDGGTAITAKMANLRAGPNRDYPLVTILRPNVPVQVLGCLPHYSWCDVLWGPTRGWIYGGNLVYISDGRPVALPDYGQQIGLAIVGFALADYWFNHYRGRTWYRDRVQWEHRPHYRPPPPLPPRPGGGGFNPGYNNRPPDYGNRPPPRPGGDGFNPGGNNRPPDNGNRPPPNGGGQGGGGQGGRPSSAAPPRAPVPAARPPAAASRPAAAPSRPAPSRER